METTYKPDQLGGWHVGDMADVQTLGRVQVEELRPPSEIVVRTSTGKTCRVGYRVLRRVRGLRRVRA